MYTELTGCPLFRGMTAVQIENILAPNDNYVISNYKAGDVIAKRDTAYSGLMIILKGAAIGRMEYSSGQIATIESIEAPQLIAPAFLFGGYNRLPIDVVAQSDVEILTLHRGFIFELMQENTLILSNFIDIISNRANVWSKKIYFLSFKSLKEKLASYLLDHSSVDKVVVPIPDITEIAEFFAATRSSLMSVFEGLEKKHLIEINDQSVKILNRSALNDILK